MNPPPRSFDALIADCGLPRHEARALLESVCDLPRVWLIAHGDESPDPPTARRFDALAQRRRQGEPLAYLTGWREFYGRALSVDPSVLIPRPDTEPLVAWAIAHARASARVLDLGTGSGAIALTLALERADLRITATDLSTDALTMARRNAAALGASVDFLTGDWFDALRGQQRFDLILSNPPYIAADDPHLTQDDLRFEPRSALTDGADGLGALRAIIAGASAWLKPDGWIAVEHGWRQGESVRALLNAAAFGSIITHPDAEGRDRFSVGIRGA